MHRAAATHHFVVGPVVCHRERSLPTPLHRVQVEENCDVPRCATHISIDTHTHTYGAEKHYRGGGGELRMPAVQRGTRSTHDSLTTPDTIKSDTTSRPLPPPAQLTCRRSRREWTCWPPGGCVCRLFRGRPARCRGERGSGRPPRSGPPAAAR